MRHLSGLVVVLILLGAEASSLWIVGAEINGVAGCTQNSPPIGSLALTPPQGIVISTIGAMLC